MDGYSVKDAAIVLGIPERRVWELLARGVLAGAPEGPDGMIVFLQPRSAPPSMNPASAMPPGGAEGAPDSAASPVNGNAGSHEPSPFRELLTEFRNLTERYGQALLALGEARGEVAALRGRVDLLEARMDLRLPGARPASTVAWEIPDAVPEAPAPAAVEAEAPPAGEPAAAEPAPAEHAAVEPAAGEPVAEPVAAELEETVAGEDGPAAEPMIDLVDETAFAEPSRPDEPPRVEEVAAVAVEAEEPLPAVETEATAPDGGDVTAGGIEPEVGPPKPMAEPIPVQVMDEAAMDEVEGPPEPPRRRDRSGRTATAAFAAALARADDPTIAELPGAEETAAALAALQRDIDASRTEAGPAEPEAVAEPEALAELEPIVEPAPIAEPEAAALPEPVQAEAEARPIEAVEPEPAQPSVPSYYSTEVVEPDWFADGDFSWLEAAQAEAAHDEATKAEAEPMRDHAEAEAPAETTQDAADDEDEPPGPPRDQGGGGELSAVPIDVGGEATGVAAELAFGEHPSPEARPPDLGHEGFEPSAQAQAMAEEEAKAAIQDAFEEVPGPSDQESPAAAGAAVAVATAVAEPESAAAEAEEPDSAEESPVTEAVAEESAEAGEAAIQEAFEPTNQPAQEDVHEEQEPAFETAAVEEAEVEAEAIQEAFDEPMPEPVWTAPVDATDTGPPDVDEPPRASDESPTTSAAALSAEAWRGPEEFIAPPAPMGAAMPPPAHPQPTAASGEEELMWLGDEFEAADLEVAAQGWRSPGAASPAQATPPALELSDAELAQLAEDEGWDLDEVEAIRRLLGRPSDAPPPSPAQREASDILDQPARPEPQPAADAAARPVDPPAAGAATPDLGISGAQEALPPPESASSSGLIEGGGGDPDQDWPQGRSGTAAEAYRRLRKLFPS